MSVFRVEKNSNYTVISNHHLRDKNLSLRTIGLLSLILSLPDNWDYSQAGLTSIVKDGEDSVRSGLKELEKFGYLERERERDELGHVKGMIYHIYEVPKDKRGVQQTKIYENSNETLPKRENPIEDLPVWENPILDKPTLGAPKYDLPTKDFPAADVPRTGEPTLEELPQINKDTHNTYRQNKEKQNKDEINTDLQNKDIKSSTSSIHHVITQIDRLNENDRYYALKDIIQQKIGYEYFQFKSKKLEEQLSDDEITNDEYTEMIVEYDLRTVDQIVGYILDILISKSSKPIKIGDEVIERAIVRSKFMELSMYQVKQVVRALNTMSIKNPKKYAISMLYNA